MISRIAALLPSLQQDPTPLTDLVEKLTRPSTFTFSRVLAIRPAIDFVAGLSSPAPSINLLALSLLGKASLAKSDCDIVAAHPQVVAALVLLWLSTMNTGVAQSCHRILVGLLMAGCEVPSTQSPIDDNLMWRRLFRDRDVYGSIFSLCSLQTLRQDGQLGIVGKTQAQARLLDLLVLIDSEPVRSSQFPDIEGTYGITDDGGLLTFATMHMIDFKNDDMMHLTLIRFCIELVRSPSPISDSSRAIDFLTKAGLHSRIVSYYTEAGEIDTRNLTSIQRDSARYVSIYAHRCPSHLLRDSSVLESILKRLSTVFDGADKLTEANTADVVLLLALPNPSLWTESQLGISAASFARIPREFRTKLYDGSALKSDVMELGPW